jgi:HEAT repeat protein
MTNLPTPDIDGAISLLESDDVQIRQFTAYLLGQAGDRRAVEPLIRALSDDHPGVRGAAANALGQLGDPIAVPHLLGLVGDDNRQIAVWAAFALTRLGESYFHVLVNALRSDDVNVRRSAILAMSQLGDARAIEPLLGLRDDHSRRFESDSTVADAVAKALQQLGYEGE